MISPRHSRRVHAAAAFALLAAAPGCGSAGADSTEPIKLTGTVLTDSTELAIPMDLVVTDSMILVHDTRGAHVVRVFSLAGKPLAGGGRKGSAPSEFVDPAGFLRQPGHPGELWVHDSRLVRLTRFRIADLVSGTRTPPQVVPLGAAFVVDRPLWLDDTTLVALSPMMTPQEKRFAFFGADGHVRPSRGDPPPGERTGLTSFVRQQVFGGRMAVHPGAPRFVLASHYAGRIEEFGRDGARVRGFEVPDPFEPDVRPAPDRINFKRGDRFRIGYVDVATTPDRVYALFSGRYAKERDDAYFGDEIQEFDWNGHLRRRFRLDVSAMRIAIGTDSRTLYAVRHDPYPQVVSYRLP